MVATGSLGLRHQRHRLVKFHYLKIGQLLLKVAAGNSEHPKRPNTQMKFLNRVSAILLIVSVAVGTYVRFQGVELKSLWEDELFVLAMAQYFPLLPEPEQPMFRRIQVHEITYGDTFWTAKAAEQNPPLYDLLVKASVKMMGANEWASRLPAVLAGCALLLAFAWRAWRETTPHLRKGLVWSVFLLAQYPILIEYSREGRAYSLGVFAVGVGGLLWLSRWRDGWKGWQPPSWVELLLFTLACYSHYQAALLVAILLLVDAVTATVRRSTTAWLRLLTFGLLFSVWLALNGHAIYYAANGGVAWSHPSLREILENAALDSATAVHGSWILLTTAILMVTLGSRWRQQGWVGIRGQVFELTVLGGLVLSFFLMAIIMSTRAGMAHPRYFTFIIPFIAVMMGLVLAQLRNIVAIVLVASSFIALAKTSTYLEFKSSHSDFRSMSIAATRDTDVNTIFVFPWKPNRVLYRISLEGVLHRDPEEQMIGLSTSDEVDAVCRVISGRPHVVAFGHDSGRLLIDAVYARCGEQWPHRTHEQFLPTFSEHWRAR